MSDTRLPGAGCGVCDPTETCDSCGDLSGSYEAAVGNVNLRDAIARAVDGSDEELKRLASGIGRVVRSLRDAAKALEEQNRTLGGDGLVEELLETAETALASASDLQKRLRRRRTGARTFRIAVFGRTQTGKSTLLEALRGGDGRRTSPLGESDFTTRASCFPWPPCLLVDVPGTLGSALRTDPSLLEREARRHVEVADLVLLVYDDLNQTQPEFARVAEWVLEYGRPVIAILNVRNHYWRKPHRADGPQMGRAAAKVHAHAGHISRSLRRYKLGEVPLVAIDAQQALWARADPYAYAEREDYRAVMSGVSREQLLEQSALPRLESLLTTALAGDGAIDLRIGGLRSGLRTDVDRLIVDLSARRDDVAERCKVAEAHLQRVSDVLGPLDSLRPELRRQLRALGRRLGVELVPDPLAELEDLRGRRFEPRRRPALDDHLARLLADHLEPVRDADRSRARRYVRSRIGQGSSGSIEGFKKEVIDEHAAREAASMIEDGARAFVDRRLGLTVKDTLADLRFHAKTGIAIDGSRGRGWQRLAQALGVISAGGLIRHPVARVVALVARFFSRKATRRAKSLAATNEREATRAALDLVNEHHDELEKAVVKRWRRSTARQVAREVGDQIRMALALHVVMRHLDAALRECASVRPAGDGGPSQQILIEAQREAGPRRGSRRYWLATDLADIADRPMLRVALLSRRRRRVAPRPTALSSVALPPEGAVAEFLARAATSVGGDVDAREMLTRAAALHRSGMPRVVLTGAYSSGKSSLIKRLLIAHGATELADTIDIGANPTTVEVKEYALDDMILVDTPGLLADADEVAGPAASDALGSATFALHVLTPTLPDLTQPWIQQLLTDRRRAPIPSLAIINRSDDMGVDPVLAPAAFKARRTAKRHELRRAFKKHLEGVRLDARDLFFVASDPTGVLMEQPTEIDALEVSTGWDGIAALKVSLDSAVASAGARGAGLAALNRVIWELALLGATVSSELQRLDDQDDELERLEQELEQAEQTADDLCARIERDAQIRLRQAADGLLAELAGAVDRDDVREIASRLATWLEEPVLHEELRRWSLTAAREIERWHRSLEERLADRLNSPGFRAAFEASADGAQAQGAGVADVPRRYGEGIAAASGVLKQVRREHVLEVGHRLGHKFRPWEAVKLTRKLGGLAQAAGVVGEVVSVVELLSGRGERQVREAKKQLSIHLEGQVNAVLRTLMAGTNDAPGPATALGQAAREIEAERRIVTEERGGIAKNRVALQARGDMYGKLRDEAYALSTSGGS